MRDLYESFLVNTQMSNFRNFFVFFDLFPLFIILHVLRTYFAPIADLFFVMSSLVLLSLLTYFDWLSSTSHTTTRFLLFVSTH